ncbi:MAG TPA: kelch repeat-containing protein [Gemmatimonadales bacterium]
MSWAASAGNGALTRQLDVYGPVMNVWSTKAPLPGPARDELAGAVAHARLFIMGGSPVGNANGVTTTQAYDPVTDRWTTRAPMPTARRAHAAATLKLPGKPSRIFVVAGVLTETMNAVYQP